MPYVFGGAGGGLQYIDISCPSFPCFFGGKGKENPPEKQGFLMPTEPLNSLGKGENAQKTRNPRRGSKEFKKKLGKEEQGWYCSKSQIADRNVFSSQSESDLVHKVFPQFYC